MCLPFAWNNSHNYSFSSSIQIPHSVRENKNTKIQDGVAKGRKQSTDIPRA